MKTAPKKSRRPTSSAEKRRRLCVRKTWNPGTRVERTVARRYVSFITPKQLIAEASRRLVPEWRLNHVMFFGGPAEPALELSFGSDAKGAQECVWVTLHPEDVALMGAYLLGQGASPQLMMWRAPEETGDGGEELSVPTISQAMLAQMQPVTTA